MMEKEVLFYEKSILKWGFEYAKGNSIIRYYILGCGPLKMNFTMGEPQICFLDFFKIKTTLPTGTHGHTQPHGHTGTRPPTGTRAHGPPPT